MYQLPLLAYVALFSAVLPIFIGTFKVKRTHRGMKILFFFLLTAFIGDNILMLFLNNQPLKLGLVHVYFLIEYVFIISIISIWQESNRMKWLFHALIPLYMLFWIIAKTTFEPLNGLYSITASASQVLLTLSAGYTLFVVIGNRTQSMINYNRFWVLLSFVIYYAGTLLVIALRGILIHYSIETFFLINSIDWSLKIIFNVLFAIGFLCSQTQKI